MSDLTITRRHALLAGLGATAASCATSEAAGAARFDHGVAAGDPRADSVVIWTRATPAREGVRAVPLTWIIAEDPALEHVVASGAARAVAANDYCAKVDVSGLAPGRAYHYGFFAGETASPVGRLTTLPAGAVDQVKLAVFSCSNYPFGRFHAYADMAARAASDDITAALHLGDYFYESGGRGGWGYETGEAMGRAHDPAHEIITLEDYRRRYRQYRTDPDLQAAHAAVSWILTWDDHEFANNPWMHGAQNHNEGEGSWEDRKAAALRSYFEWMPIRDPEPGRARDAIWRNFAFGDLLTLAMLETRLTGRDEQLDYGRDLGWVETAYYTGDPDRPEVITDPSLLHPTPPPDVETLRTPFDVSGDEPQAILDYDSAKLVDPANLPDNIEYRRDVEAFLARLEDPDRRMIDPAQEEWLIDTVRASHEAGVRWQVLGNQIIFAHQALFDFAEHYPAATIAAMEEDPYIAGRLELGRYGLPGNMDAWDGYPAQRDRIAAAFSAAGAHPVILTGDTHLFWANEVRDPSGARCAAEFGT
ncbi:MAG: alkaline phosphatase D family protein, partial [Maricaulaceae bacterium]